MVHGESIFFSIDPNLEQQWGDLHPQGIHQFMEFPLLRGGDERGDLSLLPAIVLALLSTGPIGRAFPYFACPARKYASISIKLCIQFGS